MKANEALTLDACLLALLHYEDSVPPHLHAKIQDAKAELADRNPDAVKHLKDIIEKDSQLNQIYRRMRRQLRDSDEQERAKSYANFAPAAFSLSDMTNYFTEGTATLRLSLIDIAIDILSSPDANYRATAQKIFSRPALQKQLAIASGDVQNSAKVLADAATQLHPIKVAMLKKIENNFFTVDDLAYSLEIPLERAQRYAKSLWNEGYIHSISSNLLKQWWWSITGAPPLTHLPESDTTLTLTAKGNFYLHPGSLGRALRKRRRFV
jgi:hypothetical protein